MTRDATLSYLWAIAENCMGEEAEHWAKRSDAAQKGHATKNEISVAKEWTKGKELTSDDTGRSAKKRGEADVMAALEMGRSKKEVAKAEAILSAIADDLTNNHGLDKSAIVSDTRAEMNVIAGAIAASATALISSMSNQQSGAILSVLTGFVALLAPIGGAASNVSKRQFCKYFGINHRAKYVQRGFENREA